MLNPSRIDIYDYLYGLFYGEVTENVYSMNEPQELTESDARDGFLVLHVGNLVDESEFSGEAFGEVRCFVEAFIPPISRGRLNKNLYNRYEKAINKVIKDASQVADGSYYIQEGTVVSVDGDEASTANNVYFTFIKSFIVISDMTN